MAGDKELLLCIVESFLTQIDAPEKHPCGQVSRVELDAALGVLLGHVEFPSRNVQLGQASAYQRQIRCHTQSSLQFTLRLFRAPLLPVG